MGDALVDTMAKKLLFVMTILLVVGVVAFAADVSGKYTYEMQGRGGGNPTVVTLTLKAAGSALTGSESRPGRDGNAMESPISEGKVDGDSISYKISRDMGGNTMVTSYKGTVKGDTIELEITRPGRNGGDPPPPVKVTAKKATS